MSIHSLSHQAPVVAAAADSVPTSAHVGPSVFDHVCETYYAGHPEKKPTTVVAPTEPFDEGELCPACGARAMYQIGSRGYGQWLGTGEADWCRLCGAEHEHASPECKKPLSEWRPILLLQMAYEVENAYENIFKPMTDEQVIQNREYLKRLIAALASADLYHIEDRAERIEAVQRRENLRLEAAALFERVGPAGTGRTFYKYLSGDYSEIELMEAIDSLKRDLAAMESVSQAESAA